VRDRWAGAERHVEFTTGASLAACGLESPVPLVTWNTRTNQFWHSGYNETFLRTCANDTHAETPTCDGAALALLLDQLSWALGNASSDDAVAVTTSEAWLNCTARLTHGRSALEPFNVTDSVCAGNETCCVARNRTRLDAGSVLSFPDACADNLAHAVNVALRDRSCSVELDPFDRPVAPIWTCDEHTEGRAACTSNADCFTRCTNGLCEKPVGLGDALWVRCILRQLSTEVRARVADRWALDVEDEVGWLEKLLSLFPVERCTDTHFSNSTLCVSNVTCNAPPCDGSTFCGECDGALCRSYESPARCVLTTVSGSDCTARGGNDTAEGCVVPGETEEECFSDCPVVLPCTNDCLRGQRASVDMPHRTLEWCEGGPGCVVNASLFNTSVAVERETLRGLSCAQDACVDRWRTQQNCSRSVRVQAPSAVVTGSFGVGVTLLAVAEAWNWTGGELELWQTWTTMIPDLQLQQTMTANLTFNGVRQTPRQSVSVETCSLNCVYQFVFRWPALCSERVTLLSYTWAAGGRSGTRSGTLRVPECVGQTTWRNNRCEKVDPRDCASASGFSLVPARVFRAGLQRDTCVDCGVSASSCTGLYGCDRNCGACRGALQRCVHSNATLCAQVGTWDGSQCVVPIARAGDCNHTLETCAGHTQSTCPIGCNWTSVPCATEGECVQQGECTDWELERACIVPGPCRGLGCVSVLAPCPGVVMRRAANETQCLSRKACFGAQAETETQCVRCGGVWRSVYDWIPGRWAPLRTRALTRQTRALVPTARWGTVIDRGAAATLFSEEARRAARRNAGLRCALAPWARALSLYSTACFGAPSRSAEPLIDETVVCGEAVSLNSGVFSLNTACTGTAIRVRLFNDATAHDLPGRRLLSLDTVACAADVTNALGSVIGQRTGDCMELVLSEPTAEMTLCLALSPYVERDSTRFPYAALALEGVAIALANASDTQLCARVQGVSGRYCPAAVWSLNLTAQPGFAAPVCSEAAGGGKPYGCAFTMNENHVGGIEFGLRVSSVFFLLVGLFVYVYYTGVPKTSRRLLKPIKAIVITPFQQYSFWGSLAPGMFALIAVLASDGSESATQWSAGALYGFSVLAGVCSLAVAPIGALSLAALFSGMLAEAMQRTHDAWVWSALVQISVSYVAALVLLSGKCKPGSLRLCCITFYPGTLGVLCIVFIAAAMGIWLRVMWRAPCS